MMEVVQLAPGLSAVLADGVELERVATGFVFTEGPLWDGRTGSLYFSDIPANRIYRWDGSDAATLFCDPSGKSNGLTWDLQGRLTVCEHLNRRITATEADGRITVLTDSYEGRRLNSPNDLVFHSSGRLYFTDPPYGIQSADFGALAEQEQPVNGLYLLAPGTTEPVLLCNDFDRPNGLAFSPDEQTLYVADTPRYHVRRFQVRADGTLGGGEVFAQFEESQGAGRPDGMKVDVAGNLYTTGPGGVWVVAPDGTILGHLRFPERTANCGWGDNDLRSLYVTATHSVYRLRTLTPGVPVR